MKLPDAKAIAWLQEQLTNGTVLNVVVNGYVDEQTDWLGGLVAAEAELVRARRIVDAAENLKVARTFDDIKSGEAFWVLRCDDYEALKLALETRVKRQ